jgi:hypothetical protein
MQELPTFVFFHSGTESIIPSMLVSSIRVSNPTSKVIQCSDDQTPVISGVDEVHRTQGSAHQMMSLRLRAFSSLALPHPAIYLDTDMLVMKEIKPRDVLESKRAVFCKRSFNLFGSFIGNQRGLTFPEYAGRPLGEVYPFVACATVTSNGKVWFELSSILEKLDPKFLLWYGDQEAIKKWVFLFESEYKTFDECNYGCLPEEQTFLETAVILHFKGLQRKGLMHQFFRRLFLNAPT